MRVALICDWYAPRQGGIEAHLDGLSARLVAAGHIVHVITSTPGVGGTLSPGLHVHRLESERIPWAGVVYKPQAIRAIGAILRREAIEVAHAHVSIVAPVGIGGASEAQRQNIPTVVTFHSFVPATPLWASIVGHLVGASHWRAIFTAVSSRVAREVSAFAPDHPFEILPNAIDVDFWTPGPPRDRNDSVGLVAVTRLRSKKRPMVLLDAVREVRRSLPESAVTLRIAGSGPLETPVKRRIVRDRLADVVELVGWRDPAGLRSLLRESDVFLSPTLRESFGLAALEARAVGVPVVAMRDSAVADFIVDGESGLLASSDSDFAVAVKRLVADRPLRERISAHNRRVRPTASWQRTMQLHEQAYAAARLAQSSPR